MPSKGKTDRWTYFVTPICAPYIARLMKEVSLMNNSVKKLSKSDQKQGHTGSSDLFIINKFIEY